jgi:hypothetical protein
MRYCGRIGKGGPSIPCCSKMPRHAKADFRMHTQMVYRWRADQERQLRFPAANRNKIWEERDVEERDRFDCVGCVDHARAKRLGV